MAGRTNPALAGSGVGCGLAGRTRPVATQSGAASWPSPHMSKSHSFFGPPPFRVPLTYARARVGSTDFARAAREADRKSCYEASMTLARLTEVLAPAAASGAGLGAFNVFSIEHAEADTLLSSVSDDEVGGFVDVRAADLPRGDVGTTLFRSASSDDDGGNRANIARQPTLPRPSPGGCDRRISTVATPAEPHERVTFSISDKAAGGLLIDSATFMKLRKMENV